MQNHKQRHSRSIRKGIRSGEESARKNIVSARVTDHEKQVLEGITKSSSKNVSDIVREAIEFWVTNRNRLCLDS